MVISDGAEVQLNTFPDPEDTDMASDLKDTPEQEKELIPKPADVENVKVELKQHIGLVGSISLVVGTMIGSGIFASPRTVFVNAGSVGMVMITWAGCGILAMFGALCYCELGTAIKESGGERTYLSKGIHDLIGFLYSWTAIIVLKPATLAAVTIAMAQYILEPFFPGCGNDPDKQYVQKIMAVFGIGMLYVHFFLKDINSGKDFKTRLVVLDGIL